MVIKCHNLVHSYEQCGCVYLRRLLVHNRGGFRGGVQGVATPPNGQSHSIKCSTTNVLRYAQALIYIARSLVVVVVSSKRVVKPLSRLAVVQPEVCTC